MKKKNLVLLFVFVLTLFLCENVMAFECDNGQDYVACGSGVNALTGIPTFFPRLISFAVALMRVLIPVILIISGTIEMFKSIISGNPDNISKGKKKIIGKYVGALLAFFIISFTTNIVKLIARGDEKSVAKSCFNCFLNNKCNNTKLACMGTPEDKKAYLDELDIAGKECEEIIGQENCPLDRCLYGYDNGSSMHCYSPKACRDIDFNNCPTDRCTKNYQSSTCDNK